MILAILSFGWMKKSNIGRASSNYLTRTSWINLETYSFLNPKKTQTYITSTEKRWQVKTKMHASKLSWTKDYVLLFPDTLFGNWNDFDWAKKYAPIPTKDWIWKEIPSYYINFDYLFVFIHISYFLEIADWATLNNSCKKFFCKRQIKEGSRMEGTLDFDSFNIGANFSP